MELKQETSKFGISKITNKYNLYTTELYDEVYVNTYLDFAEKGNQDKFSDEIYHTEVVREGQMVLEMLIALYVKNKNAFPRTRAHSIFIDIFKHINSSLLFFKGLNIDEPRPRFGLGDLLEMYKNEGGSYFDHHHF